MRTIAAVVVLALVFPACGGDDEAPPRADERGESSGASGVRVDHVRADGAAFEVTCAQPDVARLGAARTLDVADARFDEVVSITGERAEHVIALHAAGRVDRCPDAAWVLGFGAMHSTDESTTNEYARLRCVLPATPDDERCGEGGPFWYGTDPSEDGTEGDGRSAVWVDARAQEPGWRADPLEVIRREVGVSSEAAPDGFYRLYRVGLRVINESYGRVVIDAVHQSITPNGEQDLLGSDQRERYTLRRLAGRSGWYQDTFIVAQYASRDLGDGELDASWTEIDHVIVDVDRR